MSHRIAAEVFPPGDFLREELETRGWTQADLAELMGRPLRSINEIINGKKSITAETAIGLGHALGTSAAGTGVFLESIRLFDVYTGEQAGEGRKSLAYKLRFRAPDRTLTAEEASAARDAAVAEAERRTGAVLRGAS